MDTYTQYIKDNFFVDGFWTENEDGYFLLEEIDKGGESQLRFKVQSPENLGILNIVNILVRQSRLSSVA